MRYMIAAAALALTSPGAATLAADQAESAAHEAPEIAVVMDMVNAWNTRDWDRVADLFAEDGVLHSMMVDPVIGRETIRARIAGLGAGIEEITLDVHHIGMIDGLVFVERTDELTYNGHEGAVPVVGVIAVGDDGLITEWREYYDRAQLLGAMGLAEDFDAHEE